MQVTKKDLEKSQAELSVILTQEEFEPFIKKGAEKISQEVKIEGFRPGKAPFDILKKKIGEMSILEEAAHIAIHKTLDKAIEENLDKESVGQPRVEITKLAPGNPLEYKVIIALYPEITLGNYRDAKVKKEAVKVADKDVDKILDELREMRVSEAIADKKISNGDKVIADISMYLDNVPVDGGQSKDIAVIIGRNYIVPGFDKKLEGASKGSEREFSLPYPKDFHMKNLAGKMVDFKVKIKEIYERKLPELDKNFASAFGQKTVEELKANIKKSVQDQKDKENDQIAERKMLEKIVEKTRFGDIPEVLVEHESKIMQSELEQAVTQQGGKMDDYIASLKKTREQLMLDMLPEAVKRVKSTLAIREIAKKEKIKIGEEEIKENIQEMKKYYKDNKDVMSRIDAPEFKNYIINVLTTRKTVDRLKEWNIEK